MLTVDRFLPDAVILQIGTNDLSFKPPETIGSEIDELSTKLPHDYSVRVVGICFVTPRSSVDHTC